MDANRVALVGLAGLVLVGDFWLDWTAGLSPSLAASAAVRTVLLLLTIAALLKPSRPLVLLAAAALVMAVIRRGLFLAPVLPTLIPGSSYLIVFHSGLDLAFRVVLLGWIIAWLGRGRAAE